MDNSKYNAVTHGFKIAYQKAQGGKNASKSSAKARRALKRRANKLARKHSSSRPFASEYCW